MLSISAREHFTTDSVLEVLFRMAVTAGKKIKTEAPLAHGNPSVIHQAVSHLKEQGYDMHGKTCMVIGNGEMGKVAAQTLRDAGANVYSHSPPVSKWTCKYSDWMQPYSLWREDEIFCRTVML